MKWRELYAQALERLDDPQAARWLTEEASGGQWPFVLDEQVAARPGEELLALVERCEAGEPVQYVLGHWAFRQLDLMVDRRALIPRPETEAVVEVALRELDRLSSPTPLVVDLGTGCGAIALSVASERPAATVWAVDSSAGALDVASANLAGLGARCAGRAQLAHGDWWSALPDGLRRSVDLAIANPPYVAAAELALLPPEVSLWEPLEALVAGETGLEAFRSLIRAAPEWLRRGGTLVCEMAPDQGPALEELAIASGFVQTQVFPDLSGRERAFVARL